MDSPNICIIIHQRGGNYYKVKPSTVSNRFLYVEEPSNSKKKIKIPTVCAGFGIPYINSFELLKRQNVRFILQSR